MPNLVAAVTHLVADHAAAAYALAFLLAMSEALPVVGAFVPGTAIILGISALVPSGAVKLAPLILTTTLGAIIGDGFSFWLGHHYHRAIVTRWPLSRYSEMIARGEAMFNQHGGKSVFIARFTPGVRAIVPLIAGVLRLSVWRFYVVNVLSALVWAPSHVLAGALVGASLTLVGAIAGRLLVLLVVLAALIFAVAWATRYALRRAPRAIAIGQNLVWTWVRGRDDWVSRQVCSFLDPVRPEAQGLALLGLLLIAGLWVFLGVLEDMVTGDPLVRANVAIFQFLQSLRVDWMDQVMVGITELGDGVVTATIVVLGLLWFASFRAWRTALYWSAAVGVAMVFTLILKLSLHLPRPDSAYTGWDAFSFPSGHTTVSTAAYGFLAVLAIREASPNWRLPIALSVTLLVSAIAFSRLYLGAHWLADAAGGMAFGAAWVSLLSISYIRHGPPTVAAGKLCVATLTGLIVVGGFHIYRLHGSDMTRYAMQPKIQTIATADWWRHGWTKLPVRRVDLGGGLEEPLTIQWVGDLHSLERQLTLHGWRPPPSWSIRSMLKWLAAHPRMNELPVLPRLQNGYAERLIVVRPAGSDGRAARLVLRLWKTDVVITNTDSTEAPLWVGTVAIQRELSVMSLLTVAHDQSAVNGPRDTLAAALPSTRLARRDDVALSVDWDASVLLAKP